MLSEVGNWKDQTSMYYDTNNETDDTENKSFINDIKGVIYICHIIIIKLKHDSHTELSTIDLEIIKMTSPAPLLHNKVNNRRATLINVIGDKHI